MSTIRATFVQHGSSPVPNITLNASGQVIVASGIVSSGTFATPSGSVSAPGLYFVGDSNTGIYSPSADTIAFTEGGVESVRIDSSGRVGIGTTSPSQLLTIAPSSGSAGALVSGPASNAGFIEAAGGASTVRSRLQSSTTDAWVGTLTNHPLWFSTNDTERARIDTSGRLLVGTSTARSIAAITSQSQIEGTTFDSSSFSLTLNSNDAQSPYLEFAKTRGTSNGSNTVVQNGDQLGYIGFAGADGSDLGQNAAAIAAYVDGTPGANDMPGRLTFSTTADGASSPTERMRIENRGVVRVYSANDVVNGSGFTIGHAASASTDRYFFQGAYGSTNVLNGTVSFQVTTNGNVANTNNSYGAISDIKLKENIVDAGSQWDDIKALQVRKYNFKEGQTHTQIGLVAQEVELVSPGLVSESPDRDAEGNDLGTVTKSVNYSVLYMKAVKALQEAMERIETLEAKVAALESA